MDIAKRVARNAVYKTASLIIGNASGLFLTVYLARLLKPEQYGIYSLALSIAMLAIAFANLGIDGAVIRYLAYYAGKRNIKKVRGHFRYFLKVKAVLITAISIAIILSSGAISAFFGNPDLKTPLMVVGLLVFFASFTNFLNAFFVALQEFKFVFFRQLTYEISRWIFVIPLATFFLATGALGGVVAANLSALVVLALALFRSYRDYIFGEAESRDKSVRVFMGFMTIASISGIIYTYVDSLMIGYFLTTTDVGYYRAAYTLVFAIVGLLNMANVLLPVFTQLEGKDLLNAINRLAKYTTAIAFPAALGLAFLSEDIIKTLYGTDYLAGAFPLGILSFVLIPASFNYLLVIFNAKELPQYSAYVIITSMLINVALNYILINLFGISGAAIATLISRIFVIVCGVFLLYRVLGIGIPLRVVLKPAFCSVIMLLVLMAFPDPNTLFVGVVEVVLSILLYFILLFTIKGLTWKDVNYLLVSLGVKRGAE